jgi:uncharacterized protein (TIGR00369 family)
MTTYVKDIDTGEQTGLDQMRFFKSGGLNYKGIGQKLGFELTEVEEGRVVFAATPNEDAYNPLGSVHGGYIATLLDSALGCAVHTTLKPRIGYTTLELKINYLRALSASTGRIEAEGRVVQIGRRAAFAEGKVTDAKGRVYATATTTCLVFDR